MIFVFAQQQDELSRKRKAPVASSVVRVNRAADEDSDDMEEEDTGYGGRSLSSRVSLPSKPERKSVFFFFLFLMAVGKQLSGALALIWSVDFNVILLNEKQT